MEYVQNRWNSRVVYGVYTSHERVQFAVLLHTPVHKPCLPPVTCDAAGVAVFKVNSGPEDPRVFLFKGELYVSFFSYDSIVNGNATSPKFSADYGGAFETGTDECVPTADGLIGRMYVSKINPAPLSPCILGDLLPVTLITLITLITLLTRITRITRIR